jgi:hypothetical protein
MNLERGRPARDCPLFFVLTIGPDRPESYFFHTMPPYSFSSIPDVP